MSDPKNVPEAPETIACEICMKEIPKDLSKSEESVEYIYYFCGQNCFDKWHKKANKKKSS